MNKFNIIVLCSILIFASCKEDEKNNQTSSKPLGFDISNMDTNSRPQDDFYQYVNGVWSKKNPVPSTESRWGSFNEVYEQNLLTLKGIMNSSINSEQEKGTNLQKISDFYFTAMDSASLNKKAAEELTPILEEINSIKNFNEYLFTIVKNKKYGLNPFFGYYVTTDSKNSSFNISYFSQSGLGLPDRDYYLTNKEPYTTWQNEYKLHIAKMLAFLGETNAENQANQIYELEKQFAEISMDRVTRRNPDTTYNKMSYTEFKNLNPLINWDETFKLMGNLSFDSCVVSQPYFFSETKSIVKNTPVEIWKSYLKWNLISSNAPYLSDEIALENFNFYSKTLSGTKERKPRWKRVIQSADANLSDILGQEYVKKAFSEDAKNKVHEMVDYLQDAFKVRIENLEWMSNETKQKALEKLSSFTRKLAFPDKWKDMSALEIERDSYFQNISRCRLFWFNYMISKLGKPVDKTEWGMSPSTVNAYYSPSKNEIVFPAGIMQPPFFNIQSDMAVNFGGIGAVIGHELSHGFDDQGSKYDAEGNLKNWWTDDDKQKFEERTKLLGEQFDAFTVLDSFNVNGKLTMGENIADLGGITMAFYAYQKYMEKNSRDTIQGFTPEQRFFIGWGQVWRVNFTNQELIKRIKTDPHSPGKFRCNGPLSNFRPFYEAFSVTEKDKMYRSDDSKIVIW